MFAMPETGIGFFPDVGGSFFLPRLPGRLGFFLGLTGARLMGADVVHAGVATHYVPAAALPAFEAALAEALRSPSRPLRGASALAVVRAVADAHAAPPAQLPPPGPQLGATARRLYETAFSASTVEGVRTALEAWRAGAPEVADAVLAALAKASPTALKLTHTLLQRGAALSLARCYALELRAAARCMQSADFVEGVTALLVEKRPPVWRPATLADVSVGAVEAYLAPGGVQDLELE